MISEAQKRLAAYNERKSELTGAIAAAEVDLGKATKAPDKRRHESTVADRRKDLEALEKDIALLEAELAMADTQDGSHPAGVAPAEVLPGATGPDPALVAGAAPAPAASVGVATHPVAVAPAEVLPGVTGPVTAATREGVAGALDRAALGEARHPHGSPVHPAGADPAGAILEGDRTASMQSPGERAFGPGSFDPVTGRLIRTHHEKDGGPVRITAKREGFRRAGMAHPALPVDHPAGTFSEKAIVAMEADPMLIVQRLADD